MGVYYISGIPYSSDYLMHFGIKGQKWGVRKYQNEDGSYTEAGKERYTKMRNKYERIERKRIKAESKSVKRENRFRKPDIKSRKYRVKAEKRLRQSDFVKKIGMTKVSDLLENSSNKYSNKAYKNEARASKREMGFRRNDIKAKRLRVKGEKLARKMAQQFPNINVSDI